jgi:hypothetical protein
LSYFLLKVLKISGKNLSITKVFMSLVTPLPDNRIAVTIGTNDPSLNLLNDEKLQQQVINALSNIEVGFEQTTVPPFLIPPTQRKDKTECFYYKKGYYKSGINCMFIHQKNRQKICPNHLTSGGYPLVSDACCYPHPEKCKRNASGKCRLGDKCQYFHPTTSSNTTNCQHEKIPTLSHWWPWEDNIRFRNLAMKKYKLTVNATVYDRQEDFRQHKVQTEKFYTSENYVRHANTRSSVSADKTVNRTFIDYHRLIPPPSNLLVT